MEGKPDPTPRQIEEQCEIIRRNWSPRILNSRWQGPTKSKPWTIPTISADALESAIQDAVQEEQ